MSALTESEWRMRVLELLGEIADSLRPEVVSPDPALLDVRGAFVEGGFFRRAEDPKPEIEPTVFPPEEPVVATVVGFENDANDSLGLGANLVLSGRGGFNSPGPQDE